VCLSTGKREHSYLLLPAVRRMQRCPEGNAATLRDLRCVGRVTMASTRKQRVEILRQVAAATMAASCYHAYSHEEW
jgi:hypothetical protein